MEKQIQDCMRQVVVLTEPHGDLTAEQFNKAIGLIVRVEAYCNTRRTCVLVDKDQIKSFGKKEIVLQRYSKCKPYQPGADNK